MDNPDIKEDIVPGDIVYYVWLEHSTQKIHSISLFVLKVFDEYVIVLEDESISEYKKRWVHKDFRDVENLIEDWETKAKEKSHDNLQKGNV